ncbi:MAG: cell division protein WhiA [Gaiellaceae bacterium]|nr:cell division protein WhiA [Gaiellaceae bacterium]
MNEAGVLGRGLGPLERPPRRVVARACCRGAYLRGALLGGGSLSGPRAPHLEIRTAARPGAEFLVALAAEQGTRLGLLERRSHVAVYAKGTEQIADVLAAAGAGTAVLSFEERAVFGATRARANRLANADHANLVRTSRAAHVQLLAVRRLAELGTLELLSPALREAADLRVRHPSASLRELAGKCRPASTKASIHRRLRKLTRLANES